jgi:hypothetical protein
MRIPRQTIVIGVLSVFVLILAFAVYVKLTFQINLTPLTQALREVQRSLPAGKIDTLDQAARAGTLSWRKVDYRSVGLPREEAKLLELRHAIDYFTQSFGQPPVSVEDLSRFLTLPQVSSNQKRLYQELIRSCQVSSLQNESYILNCDGWVLPSPSEIQELVKTFQVDTERFYVLPAGHVILFVPPPVTGKPFLEPHH